jgi:hypothetical protein
VLRGARRQVFEALLGAVPVVDVEVDDGHFHAPAAPPVAVLVRLGLVGGEKYLAEQRISYRKK